MSNLFLAQDLRVILNKFTMELLWGFVVGLIFSTVGAAGGILAGVGHLSIFGIRDANLVKFYNQFLVALSPLISLPLYLKQKVYWVQALEPFYPTSI